MSGPLTWVALSGLCLNVAPTSVEMAAEVEAPESSRYVAPAGPRRIRVTPALRAEVVAMYGRGVDRSLITNGSTEQLRAHLGIAKTNGVTEPS
jgi:hypothetical protein